MRDPGAGKRNPTPTPKRAAPVFSGYSTPGRNDPLGQSPAVKDIKSVAGRVGKAVYNNNRVAPGLRNIPAGINAIDQGSKNLVLGIGKGVGNAMLGGIDGSVLKNLNPAQRQAFLAQYKGAVTQYKQTHPNQTAPSLPQFKSAVSHTGGFRPQVKTGKFGLATNPAAPGGKLGNAVTATHDHAFASTSKAAPTSKHTPPIVKTTRTGGIPDAVARYQANQAAAKSKGQGSTDPATPTLSLQDIVNQGGKVGTMLDPAALSLATANAQYGPVIAQLLQQQTEQPLQGKQNVADIHNWYGQVQKSLGDANTNEKSANSDAVTALQNISQGIIGSLGGAANQGSGIVGSVAQGGINTEKALGGIQQNENSLLSSLFTNSEGGAANAEAARQSGLGVDIANQLAQAQGSRDSLQQTSKANIIGQNNTLAQQRFQNQLGGVQAIANQKAAQQSAFLQSLLDGSLIDYRGQQGQAATTRAKAAAVKAANTPAKGSFGAASPAQKQAIAAALAQAATSAGGAKNVQGAWAKISQGLTASGWNPTDPAIRSWVAGAVLPAAGISPAQVWGG